MFVLNSDITIGKFRFSGVNDVRIERSLHSINDTATIKIPSIAKTISGNNIISGTVITGNQFIDGDPVKIQLGYNGTLQTEFSGFVKRRSLNMPLEVECEGYSWLLRRNRITKFWKTITVKDLLEAAVSGIDSPYAIEVQCAADLQLSNISINNLTGYDVVTNIEKYTDGCLSCFFIQPNILWCGLVYTPIAKDNNIFGLGSVNYRLGYNLIKDNSLKERLSEAGPVEIKYTKKRSDGVVIQQKSDAFKSPVTVYAKVLNHVMDPSSLKEFANEKAYRLNYSGYEGSINGFLQPYATPGFSANVIDDRYPERNGTYIVEGTKVHFGINGAKRIVELGPLMGFANK